MKPNPGSRLAVILGATFGSLAGIIILIAIITFVVRHMKRADAVTPVQTGHMRDESKMDPFSDHRLPPYLHRHWMSTKGSGGSLLLPPIEVGSVPRQLIVPRFSPSTYQSNASKEETSPDDYRLPPQRRQYWVASYGDMLAPPPARPEIEQQPGILPEPTTTFQTQPHTPKIVVIIYFLHISIFYFSVPHFHQL